jgi:hypothetical protein
LFTDSWSGRKLDCVASEAERRLDPREKGNRGSRYGDGTKKSAPRKVRCIEISHTPIVHSLGAFGNILVPTPKVESEAAIEHRPTAAFSNRAV